MPASPSLRTLHASHAAKARWHHDAADVEDVRRALAAEKLAAYIKRTVDAAPPLTADQRNRLVLLLAGGGADVAS